MEEIYSYLKKEKDNIENQGEKGCAICQQIINVYGLHYSCPRDPGARGILSALVDDYRKKYDS